MVVFEDKKEGTTKSVSATHLLNQHRQFPPQI